MTTNNDDKNHPTCVFYGGTLHLQKQKRLMFGFLVGFIMEPVYARDKNDSAERKHITHRQTYRRDPRSDSKDGLGYVLHAVEEVTR